MIDQIQNIPSSTALRILKTWPSHHVGGEPNLLFMVLTQISVTIESIKKVTCVQNESFKIKTARVTYVFFESVTLNKYSKISVPTPTISVFQFLHRSPTSPPTHNINIPNHCHCPYSPKILISLISTPNPHLLTILTSPIPTQGPLPLQY